MSRTQPPEFSKNTNRPKKGKKDKKPKDKKPLKNPNRYIGKM